MGTQPKEPSQAAAEEEAEQDTDNKTADKKLQELYSSCQAAVLVLLNERNMLAMDLLYYFLKPFRQNYTKLQKVLRAGPVKVQEWYAKVALGQQFLIMQQLWGMTGEVDALLDCGFILEVCDTCIDESLPDDPVALEQDHLAKQVNNLVFHLVAEFCKDACTHTWHPLALAAGFRASKEEDQQLVLGRLSQIYKAWSIAKVATSPTIRALVARSPLQGRLENDLLSDLAAVNFEIVTPAALQLCDAIFLSLGSSLACELGFRVWEGTERRGSSSISYMFELSSLVQYDLDQYCLTVRFSSTKVTTTDVSRH